MGAPDEPGGQVQGDLTFRYWIVPLAGAPDRARLFDLAQQLAAGTWDVQLLPEDMAVATQDGPARSRPLPPTAGFLAVTAPAAVTSMRLVGEALEVRMFNPENAAARVTLSAGGYVTARRVDFESRPLGEPLRLAEGRVTLDLGPHQIVTVSLGRV